MKNNTTIPHWNVMEGDESRRALATHYHRWSISRIMIPVIDDPRVYIWGTEKIPGH